MEQALDHLVVEAYTLGVPLEELGWRLSRRIESFRRQRAASERDHRGAGQEEGQ
jgi:hypothetical protein